MFVVCKVQNCGYCSDSGFCLNRLVVINEQGLCGYLTKPGWEQPVEDRFKNNWKAREPVQGAIEGGSEEESYERYVLDDVCNW